jgi:hypothetical protein
MNYLRLVLAAGAGTVAYFTFGFLVFSVLPLLRREYARYPAVYRSQEDIRRVMPMGLVAMFVAILVLTVIYALAYQGGSGAIEGTRFGALVGVFAVCAFVIHNHVNLNIRLALTIRQAIAYFIEWTIVGYRARSCLQAAVIDDSRREQK